MRIMNTTLGDQMISVAALNISTINKFVKNCVSIGTVHKYQIIPRSTFIQSNVSHVCLGDEVISIDCFIRVF